MAPRPATDTKRWNAVSGGRTIRRRPPKQSTLQKAIGMLAVGKKAAPSKSSSRGGTAGKAAMLTAAAGFAYKNRDKIGALLNKRRQQSPEPAPTVTPASPPVAPQTSTHT
jgi:hypothetical protein